jgi:MOSC domain-containing protein YiiM
MFQGQLEGIFIVSQRAKPLVQVDEILALPGKGLQGDRYGDRAGTFSKPDRERPEEQLTLIEAEALEAAQRDYQITILPAQTRRNLLTRGVPLNHLVGREFMVGEVRCRGLKLCEPCNHLEKLTMEGNRAALVHRGGLRAQVVAGGTLRAGDVIKLCVNE